MTDNFPDKLKTLQSDGVISTREKEDLLVLTDAGGAAAHRGWRPEPDQLATILDVVEAFLHRALVLGSAVEKMKASVPRKQKRPKKRGA